MEWLNYHHLMYFWVTAREGSMTRAAAKLHVTPATLSIQIRELEKFLGRQLFRKSGRGLALTETGESVMHYASDIFATGEEMMNALRGKPLGAPLLFRVGVKDVMPKIVAYRLLEPALKSISPLRLVCREGDLENLISELSIHRLDVVLSDTPIDPRYSVRAYSHLLGESSVSVLATRELAASLSSVGKFPENLNRAPFLLPTSDTVLRRSLDLWFHDHQIEPDIRCEFEDAAMLKIAGKEGLGVFVAPTIIVSDVERMYGVSCIGELPITERFYALSVERKIKHPAVLAISTVPRQTIPGDHATKPIH
ncbi:MAG: LysR family transcriptional regulator [Pirellula sp.]|jgi:LysR family transcriptional activator of nhaA|nr:LysR family transcriptional regulator [Pirellula sp.]